MEPKRPPQLPQQLGPAVIGIYIGDSHPTFNRESLYLIGIICIYIYMDKSLLIRLMIIPTIGKTMGV